MIFNIFFVQILSYIDKSEYDKSEKNGEFGTRKNIIS